MNHLKAKQPFEEKGSEISSRDAAELIRNLDQIDTTVPGRTEGRRSHHRERYCIVRYLGTLATASRLAFPLRVVKWESPDFFLYSPGLTVGLEITDAGTQKGQKNATRLEKSPFGSVLEDEANLQPPGEPLQGHGYVDDEPKQELARLVLERLEKKTAKLNSPHFQAADRCDLLVYDNTDVLGVLAKLHDLAPIIKDQLIAWQAHSKGNRKFSRISVLRDSGLLHDCTGEASVFSRR